MTWGLIACKGLRGRTVSFPSLHLQNTGQNALYSILTVWFCTPWTRTRVLKSSFHTDLSLPFHLLTHQLLIGRDSQPNTSLPLPHEVRELSGGSHCVLRGLKHGVVRWGCRSTVFIQGLIRSVPFDWDFKVPGIVTSKAELIPCTMLPSPNSYSFPKLLQSRAGTDWIRLE